MDNLTGGSGRADNVESGSTSVDLGIGINTTHAMQSLETNRAMYQKDQSLETAYGQMKEPDPYEEKVTKPGFV